jgi:hypothetical protein
MKRTPAKGNPNRKRQRTAAAFRECFAIKVFDESRLSADDQIHIQKLAQVICRRIAPDHPRRSVFEIAASFGASVEELLQARLNFTQMPRSERTRLIAGWHLPDDAPDHRTLVEHQDAKERARVLSLGVDFGGVIFAEDWTLTDGAPLEITIAAGTSKDEALRLLESAMAAVRRKWEIMLDGGEEVNDFTAEELSEDNGASQKNSDPPNSSHTAMLRGNGERANDRRAA